MSFAAFDFDLAIEILGAFAPPLRLSPAEWAEANIILPGESNAEPGPLPFDFLSARHGRRDCRRNRRHICFHAGVTDRKQVSIDCALGFAMAQDPGPVLHVSPTRARRRISFAIAWTL